MRYTFLFFGLLFGFLLSAQNTSTDFHDFIRVYNLQGDKIAKGKVAIISGDSLKLIRKDKTKVVLSKNIGKIRTKHSMGNNFLIGAASGAAIVGVAVATDDSWLSGPEMAPMGAGVGALYGGAIGGLTAIFKNSKTYKIDGDKEKWEAFKKQVNGLN